MPADIVHRLRDRAYAFKAPDPLVEEAADEIARLRLAIRRLAEQDATLSVQGGSVTVTMDATLTDAERSAIRDAADRYASLTPESVATAATLRGLLERLGPTGSEWRNVKVFTLATPRDRNTENKGLA